jgi:hypothetical protein
MLFLMCFAYHSRLMPLLLTTVFVMFGLSLLSGLITKLCFKAEVQQTPSEVKRKDAVSFKIRIHNRFFLPLTPVRVYVRGLERDKYGSQRKMLITSLGAFKEMTFNVQNDTNFRGEYTIGLDKVEFFDILKIFRFSVASSGKSSQKITVYPREPDFDKSALVDENEEEPNVLLTKPHGFNKDTFAYLREYREGESLRNVHWKMSARLSEQNNLIVKQMEANHDYSALVFCDFTAKFESMEATLETSDTIIETGIGIAREILLSSDGFGGGGGGGALNISDNTASVVFWQKSGDTADTSGKFMNISDVNSYRALVKELGSVPHEPFGGEFTALLNEFANEIRLERAVYIITANIDETLVASLRDMGLIYRSNVSLVSVAGILEDSAAAPNEISSALLEFIRTQTKITVLEVVPQPETQEEETEVEQQ